MPVLCASLTVLFCCVDAAVRDPSTEPLGSQSPSPARVSTVSIPPSTADASSAPANPPTSPAASNPPDRADDDAPATADVPTEQRPIEDALRVTALDFPAPPSIRVHLGSVDASGIVTFAVKGPYRVVAGELEDLVVRTEIVRARGAKVDRATARLASTGGLNINGVTFSERVLTIVPERDGSLSIGGRAFRGGLVLRNDGKGHVTATNLIDLEEYVAGVLFGEMPERFGVEALKAQATVSRTYALYHFLAGRELADDQGSQVYRGMDRESASARRIVDATRGEVLTWNGQLIQAFFCSTCGGSTACAHEVFGIKVPPPLDAHVTCGGCGDSPNYRWSRKIPLARVGAFYKNAFGASLSIKVDERDAVGRALALSVVDSRDQVVDRPLADRFRNDFNFGKPLSAQFPSTWIESTRRDGANLRVEGRGFGHGVGMCQYGARGLASRGLGYRQILARYYPGTELRGLYD